MLRSVKELEGYAIRSTDADIGKVDAFYFDDEAWTIRYLVADTGTWLPGRLVLISPAALGEPDWEAGAFPVGLSKEQVEKSPGIEKDKPVSHQHRTTLHQYYGWPTYWGAYAYPGAMTVISPPKENADVDTERGDPHLRSTREVIGYHIEAGDGEVGHVEDFILDDENWNIHYLVVDTRNWLPGKKVLISPQWIDRVDWAAAKVYTDLSCESIKNSPEYDPSKPINVKYEARLYDYYGRPKDRRLSTTLV